MKATNTNDLLTNEANCDWIIERAKELKVLISYGSDSMIAARIRNE